MFRNKKIPYIELVPIVVITLFLYKFIDNFSIISDYVGSFLSYLSSIIWAFGIAYFLNPLMKFIEKNFKIKRGLTLLIIYLLLLGTIVLLFTIVTPRIVTSIVDLMDKMPLYIRQTYIWFQYVMLEIEHSPLGTNPEFLNALNVLFEKLLGIIKNFNMDSIFSGLIVTLNSALNLTSSFIKALFGLIVSIYLLKDKEYFIETTKKLMYSLLNVPQATNLINFGSRVNIVFSKFILGKALDSLIIGLLCFIGLIIFKIPYASIISLIVGITNMIPYFGPFIGAIPAVLITLVTTISLSKALVVALIILLLQQFDGWVLGPKILGDSVGVGPFAIILAILIGGKLFGVLGMFLSVPFIALVIEGMNKFIARKLKEKEIDWHS